MSSPDHTLLHEEFSHLRREQDEVMRRAVYGGMSADEAKEFEKRRQRLTELFNTLYVLKASDAPPHGSAAAD